MIVEGLSDSCEQMTSKHTETCVRIDDFDSCFTKDREVQRLVTDNLRVNGVDRHFARSAAIVAVIEGKRGRLRERGMDEEEEHRERCPRWGRR